MKRITIAGLGLLSIAALTTVVGCKVSGPTPSGPIATDQRYKQK